MLVVFQFTASAALIAGTMIVSKQLTFMNKADLGMNIENTLVVDGPELMQWDSTFISRVESYKHELSQIKGVISATTSSNIAGNRLGRSFGIRTADQPADTRYTLSYMGVDYNYFDAYKIKVLAGRNFLPTDHKQNFKDLTAIIINESAVKLLGLEAAEKAVGRELIWGNNGTRKWTIVGVVNDFHQESLHKPKEAMAFRPTYSTYSPTSIKIETAETQNVIPAIEATYKKFFPGNSFEYIFLDQNYQQQYNDDKRFGTIINIFTGLAIFVSCLGLMGLASYTATQRTKEIGVRKVLGASVLNILITLSKDLLKLIGLSILIATPLAWYGMSSWLKGFVYRTNISWETFVFAGLAVIFIALFTIIYQTAKVATANPVESLRSE
jgi:putative ABC transport system permease protein